ncbi:MULTISPECIES: Rv1535 domain-containing protein [Mycolicibacterium]|uniref:Rv1535 domain-containing protein n=1 Tax=Mycolicibacterium TaxID=1866885 RepID=UPI0022A80BE9|nr:Rv1535 domain-containing protein [Mycolicibacterium mageritense]
MRHANPADRGQGDREAPGLAHPVHGLAVGDGIFGHSSPFGHVVVDFSRPGLRSLIGVTTSVVRGPDPLTDVVARVLTIPLRELYAVLWRCGVVEIED